MKFFVKKLIILLVAFLILFNSSGLLTLKPTPINKAEAIFCSNCSTWAQQIISYAKDVWNYLKQAYRWIEQKLGFKMRDIIAKKIIDHIVDQTVQWIQGGGKPKFVTDWKGFLKDAGNIAFEQVLKDVGLAWLCQPFSLQVKISLLPVPKFSQRIECTLDDVVKNIEDFYKDFEKGGWIAYNESWQPQNNYFGQLIIIHDEMITRGALAQQAAQNEALAGKGFLSVKKCVLYDDYTGKCLKEQIITPGDTVGQVIARGMTSDIEWAANIQSWTSALVNAVINRLIKGGIASLQSSSVSGERDIYYPSEYQEAQNQEFESTKNDFIDKYELFLNALTGPNEMIELKEKSLSLSEELLNTYEAINDNNCTPLISESEISRVQAEINEASSTISQYKDLAIELNEQIDKLYFLTDPDAPQLQEALWESEDFFDSHNDLFIDLTATGLKKQAVQEEIQKNETSLANAKSQLEECLLE
jgi:hypothetical protein